MRKEVLFAIIAGIFVGLVVAFGVWRTNSVLQDKNGVSQENESTTREETPKTNGSGLTIASHEEGDVVSESPIAISGITKPNSWVAVSGENEDYIVKANESGSFRVDVELTGGVNQLLYLAVDEASGETIRHKQTIVYSTEFEEQLEDITSTETTSQEEATDEGDPIRERVKEKVEAARRNPKAYIGSITDKTENTLQLRNGQGEIKLVSVSIDETSIVTVDDTTTDTSFDEVAIGDFVVAMGFANENNVLEAIRVLLTETLEAPSRELHFGSVAGLENRNITIDDATQASFTFPTRWKGPEISEIGEGDKVIIISVPDDSDEPVIRTIEIVSPLPTPDEEE